MIQQELDFSGLICPLPILKTRTALQEFESGSVVRIIADDPHALNDFIFFSKTNSHELLGIYEIGAKQYFILRICHERVS